MKIFAHPLAALALAVVAVPGSPACAETLTERFQQLSPTIVGIESREWVVRGANSRQIQTVTTQGTGVLVSADGKVLTAAHLVQTADEIVTELYDGRVVKAWVVASEPATDLALLQLAEAPTGKPWSRLGDSDRMMIGDGVFTIGHPYNLQRILSVGYVSGRNKPTSPFGQFEPLEMFQTDASVHQGSSGSPLFNLQGEVIGIVTRVMTAQGEAEGMGFAIPSNLARLLLLERRSFWTGIGGYWVSGDLAKALNLPQSTGLLVQQIASHSPASCLKIRAGTAASRVDAQEFILGGDIILAMQGISLADEDGYQKVRDALAALKPGDLLSMTVLRAGRTIELASPSCSSMNQSQVTQ